MRLLRPLLYAVAILAGAVAAIVLGTPAPLDTVVKTKLPLAQAPAVLLPPVAPAPEVHVSQRAMTEAMRKRFESAPDYAAFIHDALHRPMEGGRFYAVLAYYRCEKLTGIEDKHFAQHEVSGHRDKAIVAIKDLMQRCQGVKDHLPDSGAFVRRVKLENAKGNPDVLLLERGLLAPNMQEKAMHDLALARASGDPYVIAATIEMNADHYASLFNRRYVREAHQRALYLAAAGAVCQITNTCEPNLQLQIMCAAGGHCKHSDYLDHLRDGLSANQIQEFEGITLALLNLAIK